MENEKFCTCGVVIPQELEFCFDCMDKLSLQIEEQQIELFEEYFESQRIIQQYDAI